MDAIRPPLWAALQAADLPAALRTPPDRYRPVPWLAWTGDLDWDRLQSQLGDMLAQGITEFFLFPIYGMELPYMSAAYWERVRQTLDFCRARGMKCWIYDEYNWPSGVCAGTVMRDYPEAREKLLWLHLASPDGRPDPPLPMQLHESGGTVWGVAEATEPRINVMGCDWLTPTPGYLNVLSPLACRRFLETTHEEYLRRCGDFFPDTLPGFFTDEPGPHVRAGGGWFGFIHTEDFFDQFRQALGYDLRDHLSDLLTDSPTAARTRCHFWRRVAEGWGEAYAGQTRQWCDAHGVALTGHGLGEESLISQVRMAGDLWEPLRHFTIPGIDMLANADGFTYPYRTAFYGPIDRRAFHLTCKYVHGVCRQAGTKEMMSEAYGVCDWGMTLLQQKRGFNYQLALGVTLFNDNSLITSIADFRKYVIAGKHFTQPWWQHYRQYADYNARLCALHAEGDQVADIAVLYPRSTIWAHVDADIYSGSWFDAPEGHPIGELQELIYSLLDEMVRGLWPFDFIFEPVLEQARVEGGRIGHQTCQAVGRIGHQTCQVVGRIGHQTCQAVGGTGNPACPELVTPHTRYRTLIVPSAKHLPAACLEAIRAFAAAGGEVIFAGDLPAREVDTDADLAPTVAQILAGAQVQHLPASGSAVCAALAARRPPPLQLSGDGAREFVASWRRLAHASTSMAGGCHAVCDGPRPDAESVRGGPSHTSRHPATMTEGTDFLFVANMAEAPVDVTLNVNLPGPLVVLDPDTLECCRPVSNEFPWHFEAWQAFVVVSGEAAQPGVLAPEPQAPQPWWRGAARVETLAGPWDFTTLPAGFPPAGNMLRLTCQLRPDPDNRGSILGWQRATEAEGWLTPTRDRLAEPLRSNEAPWYWLRAKVTCGAGARPERLVADNPDFLELFVNGRPARQVAGSPLWAEENVTFDLAGLLSEGDNWLHLRARTSKYSHPLVNPMPGILEHLLQPVVLVGEFSVLCGSGLPPATAVGPFTRLGPPAPTLDPARPWEEQGWPHFAGLGVYRRTLTWSGQGRLGLRLPECTDAVEVRVNDQPAGVRVWPPYVFDLTPHLRPGSNDLEIRVANTLGNIILRTYGGEAPSEYPTSGLKAAPELLVFE